MATKIKLYFCITSHQNIVKLINKSTQNPKMTNILFWILHDMPSTQSMLHQRESLFNSICHKNIWFIIIVFGSTLSIAFKNVSNNQTKLTIFSFVKNPYPTIMFFTWWFIQMKGTHIISQQLVLYVESNTRRSPNNK